MPIDIATGDVELAREDFVLPGRVPLKWTRHFRTTLLKSYGPLAPGWTTSMFPSITRVGKEWHFTSGEGDLHVFADPDESIAKGRTIRLLGAFLELVRSETRLIVTQWNVDSGEIQRFVFEAERSSDGLTLLLVGIEDVCGDGLALIRDTSGRLGKLHQRIENRTVTVSYSPQGRIASLALVTSGGETQLVGYEYDAAGRLSAVIDRRGLANRYEYDGQSRVTREILKDGSVYSYKYDEKGRCTHFSGLDHYNEKRLRFVDTAATTIVTNSYGKSSIYEYLPSGQIVSEADPSGNKRRTVFDEFNRIVARIDPVGGTTRYTYDEHGNRDSIADPLGHTYQFTFNSHHQPLSMTDPLGKTWHREYDASHRLSTSRNPLGASWTIAYDPASNPAVITDPLGSTRRLHYRDGLVMEMTDWMGHATRFAWDEFGRVVERVGPVGERTTFDYDAVGNPVAMQLPDGSRLHATYDAGDNLNSFTSANGYTTRWRYGSCHRLLERVDPIGRVVRYGWGTEPERLDRVINEKGETCSYFHDDQGRTVREQTFDDRELSFEYDAAARRVAVTNGNGEKIQFKRDAAGNLVEQSLPDGGVTRCEYDPLGRLTAAVNPDIPVKFEYDDAGRLIRETQGDEWVLTDYNAAGEITRTQTSLGHEVRYELDSNGRVRKLSTGNGHDLLFERDPRGFETGREMPCGLRLEQRFDSMGHLLEQRVGRAVDQSPRSPRAELRITSGREVIKRVYQYDLEGLLVSVKDGQWGTTDYSYDPAERLLSALRDRGLSEHFEYDATDNVILNSEQHHDRKDCSAYSSGNLLTQKADTRYEYDRDGRLVRKTEHADSDNQQVWDYSWDSEGRLRTVGRPDGAKWNYKYDAFGRRIAKVGQNSVQRFLWNGEVIIHEMQDGAQPVAWLMKRDSFVPLARVYNGEFHSIITDHIGTPREMLDSHAKVIWSAAFSAWGQTDRPVTSIAKHDCPMRFQGQWFDEESGLHYNRFRYYDPKDSRFISPDPIGVVGGLNLYQYTRNPVLWVDPFGLNDCTDPQSKEGLARSLTSEEQLAQVTQGLGTPIAGAGTTTPLRDAPRLAAQYGGAPGDWAKVRSESSSAHGVQLPGGGNFETHAYQNMATGQVVEPKTKVEGH
jgi:RHS repeat-associated protein